MPGVPSSRGCEACRKQKKKCDQSKPACSRCRRLQITCEGAGKQRYTFKEENIALILARTKSDPLIKPQSAQDYFLVKGISRTPSNALSMIAGAFASTLEVTDPRYDISCYGVFLKDIPRRLGRSEALDAAVIALTAAFPALHTAETPPNVLAKYGNSLKMLRKCMCDPKQARTADTLCAVYMTRICQIWIGRKEDQAVYHAEAMAHILNTLAEKSITDRFELEMFVTLTVVVIMEKVFNPRIQLSKKVLGIKLNDPHGSRRFLKNNEDAAIQSTSLQSLANIPEFMHHPDMHLLEIESDYGGYRIEIPKLRSRLEEMESTFPDGTVPINMLRSYSAVQTAFLFVNFMALVLNGILIGNYDKGHSLLLEEAAEFANDLLALAKQLSARKPLGGSHIPMSLTAVWAWASIYDSSKQIEVDNILSDYQTDFNQFKRWRGVALWIKSIYEKFGKDRSVDVPFVNLADINCGDLEIYGCQDFVLYL